MKKVVVITGAGRGIGAATAILLASQGYAVCVNYQSEQRMPNKWWIQLKRMVGKRLLLLPMFPLKLMS
jgi:NAD(P)-dependent dehydrogenase (short-subunit alcohol dehydrogenase family)